MIILSCCKNIIIIYISYIWLRSKHTSLTFSLPPSKRPSNTCLNSFVQAFCNAKQQNLHIILNKLHKRVLKRTSNRWNYLFYSIIRQYSLTYFNMMFPFSRRLLTSTLSWNTIDSTTSAFSGVSRNTKLKIDTMAHTICIPCESYKTAIKIKRFNYVSINYKR